MLMFIVYSTEENLVSFLCCCFPKVLPSHFTESKDVPRISRVSSWSFPAALSALLFHVPIVMLSLPQIFDYGHVAYLTPPCWCTAEGAVLVDPGGDRSGMVWLLVFIAW